MEVIHQGWLDMSATKSNSKNWLKKTVTKPWKRKFFVLCRDEENIDKVCLMAYDKEEHVVKQKTKKILDLYPRFQVAKKTELKGKEFAFQVSNEGEGWFLATESQKILDLWVIQIQMQTKLSRSISGRLFSVKAANTKQLQRVGAKDQRCLLHFTRWGLTLALQESRSVLALWPLDTIRNYECTGTGQFLFEAGRRSPMGEGKYAFFTFDGEDEVMFNVIDVFVSARLNEKADLMPTKGRREISDDEILAAYDKHHACVLGSPPPDMQLEDDEYAKMGLPYSSKTVSMACERPPSYHHLARTGVINPVPDDFESCPPASYDQLDRTTSWGRSPMDEAGYNVIDRSKGNSFSATYDRLDRGAVVIQAAGHYSRFSSIQRDKACVSPGNYPLTNHEPSVPNLMYTGEDRNDFGHRSASVSSTQSDITYSNTVSPAETDGFQVRNNSTGGRKQRRTTGDRTVTDEPPALPPPRSPAPGQSKPVPMPGDLLPNKGITRQHSEYQNTEP